MEANNFSWKTGLIASLCVSVFFALGFLITPYSAQLVGHGGWYFEESKKQVSILLALSALLGSVFLLFWGYLYDRRRIVIALTIALSAIVLGAAFLTNADGYWQLFVGMFFLDAGEKALPFLGVLFLFRLNPKETFGRSYLIPAGLVMIGPISASIILIYFATQPTWPRNTLLPGICLVIASCICVYVCNKLLHTHEPASVSSDRGDSKTGARRKTLVIVTIIVALLGIEAFFIQRHAVSVFGDSSVFRDLSVRQSLPTPLTTVNTIFIETIFRLLLGICGVIGVVVGAVVADLVRRPSHFLCGMFAFSALASLSFLSGDTLSKHILAVTAATIAFAIGFAHVPLTKLLVYSLPRRSMGLIFAMVFIFIHMTTSPSILLSVWQAVDGKANLIAISAATIFAVAAGLALLTSRMSVVDSATLSGNP